MVAAEVVLFLLDLKRDMAGRVCLSCEGEGLRRGLFGGFLLG